MLNLVGATCNQVALLAVTILLARSLGRADVGTYAQAYAFLALLAPLSETGLGVGLTRFVALHLGERDFGGVRGTVQLGVTIATLSAAVLGAALFAAAPWLADVAFDEPELMMPLRFVALALPAAAFTDVALAATLGYRTMKPLALIGPIFEPGLRLVLVVLALVQGTGLRGVMTAVLASHLVTAVLAAAALRQVMGRPTAMATYRPHELLRFSTMSWLTGLASTGLIWVDIILLGLFATSAEVGVYSVATRLVHLATFVMLPISAAFAPRIADLYQRGRNESLRRTYAAAASWIIRLSLPAFVLLVIFPRELLALFGTGFVVGATVTVILAAGKFIDAATGPCGLMLNVSGRPALNLLDNIVVLVVNILLNLLLIPRYGIVGAAAAWAVSLAIVNLARVAQVWLALRMLPFDAGMRKGLVAAAGAFVAALLVRGRVQPPADLLVGAGVIVVVYLVLLRLQGLTAEDRLVLARLRGRRRRPGWAGPPPQAADAVPQRLELVATAHAAGPIDARPTAATDGQPPRPAAEAPRSTPRTRPPFSPARYARTLWRRRLVILAGLYVGVLLGVAVVPAVLPRWPTYRATVRIDLKPFAADLAGAYSGADSPAGSELAASVLDVDVAARLIGRLGRLPTRLRATRHLPPDQWPTGLIANLKASMAPGSRYTVELSLVDESPPRAKQILQAYVEAYASKRDGIDRARTRQALAILGKQAEELRPLVLHQAQLLDRERAASPTGEASTSSQSQFDMLSERYRAKLAERERLREQAALRGRVTVPHLPPTLRQVSAPPGPTRTIALGIALGVLAAAVLALLLEAVRPRLASPVDAALATGVDVLASVPRRGGRPPRPQAREGPFNPEAEEYRRLALTLERQGLGTQLLVLAIASADRGEGRSTVAIGLAEALVDEGRGVVVVSGDLRRPVVERILGVPKADRLAEYPEGLDDSVVSELVSVRNNLMLLPSSWAGRSSASLLARPDLARAVEELRRLSMIVLVDTPPARWWVDALSLAAEADATVLVARSGRSRWKAVGMLAATLQRDRIPLLGVVLVDAGRGHPGASARRGLRRNGDGRAVTPAG
jgi:O-antigen/teichoic acid export membrane protein/Mrp family chromosome partitioning ATPase